MLKIIDLDIDGELTGDTGVFEVAFVEYPAIEQDFLVFSKQKFYRAPQNVADKACRAIRENEERGNPAATQTGKVRGQQLCNKSEISLDTVKRMKSYLERAAEYYTGNYDDNGTISYDLWGGKPALDWVNSILKEVEENFQDDGLENACWEGYEPIGLKPNPNGPGMVPNCVPIQAKREEFVYPNAGESKDDFISRCIPVLITEGKTQEQAAGACYGMWEQGSEFAVDKVSFDWDGTLTTDRGIAALENELRRGSIIYLISARNTITREIATLTNKYRIPSSNIFLTGSNIQKVEKVKELGIKRHYDDNPLVRQQLGTVAQTFDYDTSGLPAYQDYVPSGDPKPMLVKPLPSNVMMELDIFGFKPNHFDICPGAIALFKHLLTMPVDAEDMGMIRSAALQADKVFEIEKDVIARGEATEQDLTQVILLVDDFKDLMREIDEELGMSHDVSFMDGHIAVVEEYLQTDRQEIAGYIDGVPVFRTPKQAVDYGQNSYGCDGYSVHTDEMGNEVYGACGLGEFNKHAFSVDEYDADEKEAYKHLMFLKESHPEAFEAVIGQLRGATMSEVQQRNHNRATTYFRYVQAASPATSDSRDFCISIEDRFFRRMEIDLLRDTNLEFGHNRQAYSKWIYLGGPNCVHAWERWIVQGPNMQRQGLVEGLPGTPMKNRPLQGYYSEETRAASRRAYAISQNMSRQIELTGELTPDGYIEELPIYPEKFLAEDASYAMGCGGVIEEVMYEGKRYFQACSYNVKKAETQEQIFKADKERRMLYTPLMIPNILIPRMSDDGERYWVRFKPEVIEKIRNKFMIEQRLRETNYEHSNKKFNDIVMVESWIVETDNDKAYSLGFTKEQIPMGSWMAAFKILETEEGNLIWKDYIKNGKVKGASVEGNFILNFSRENSDEYLLGTIINILKSITE